jgi:putative ABC transport system permease protein
MRALLQDLRHGVRQLCHQPGSSLAAIATLALGIGVSTALFSVIEATMLRPLPYANPEQLVNVLAEVPQPDGGALQIGPSLADLRAWQDADDVFLSMEGSGGGARGTIVDGPEPVRLEVMNFTEGYLSMYGIEPVIGRGFVREDCDPGAPLVALLGYGYWQRRFAGRADVLGATIRLDNQIATIVGVLPASFYARNPLFTPLRVPAAQFTRRGTGSIWVEARLRPGVSLEEATARLTSRMPDGFPGPARATVTPELAATQSRYRSTINVFIGAVTLIVLMAGVNVAGLLLARGIARETELQVRASLGASQSRLLRQLLTESLVLALPAGALGIALAWLTLDLIIANIPLQLPPNAPVALSATVVSLTATTLLVTALLSGLTPAVRLSRADAGRVLAQSSRCMGSSFSPHSGRLLVGAEIALAVILVSGSGLMLRSFMRIALVDLGFDADGLIAMQLTPLAQEPAAHRQYYELLRARLRTVPGITAVSIVDNFALGDSSTSTTLASPAARTGSWIFEVTPAYFETIGARLRSGRFLSEGDYASHHRGVVITETAARVFFSGEDAVGGELRRPGSAESWNVLGVIGDLRHLGPINTRNEGRPQVFFPYEPTKNRLGRPMTVVVRASAPAAGLEEQLRRIAQSLGPRVVVEYVKSADALFTETVITPRQRTILLTLLAVLGLTLALVGVFGTTAYAVTRRTPEIGLRLAVGARPGQVVRKMASDAAGPIVIGTIIGLGATAWLTRAIESFLFQTSPTDPATLTAVAAVLMTTAAIAALVPAMRAARVDPADMLRAE